MLEQADVIGEFMGALGDPRKDREDAAVDLPGIGLSRHRKTSVKAHLLRDHLVRPPAFLMVAVEQLQEAGLGPGGPFRSQQLHGTQHIVHIIQIQLQLHQPQGGPLAYCGGLGRLEMGEGQGRLVFIPSGKCRQLSHHVQQLFPYQAEGFRHDDHIRIIPHIAGGSAQMDDTLSFRTLDAVGIHMGHHVMAHLALPLPGHIIVDLLSVGLELLDLLVRDRKPQLFLCLRQCDPQLPPGLEFLVR